MPSVALADAAIQAGKGGGLPAGTDVNSQASAGDGLPMLLRVEEFAQQIGVAKSTAYQIMRSDEIESVIVGERSRRIPKAAFLAYIDRLRAKNQAPAS